MPLAHPLPCDQLKGKMAHLSQGEERTYEHSVQYDKRQD